MDSGGSNKPTPKRVIKIDPTKLNSNVKDSLKLALAKLKVPTKSAKSATTKSPAASVIVQQQQAAPLNQINTQAAAPAPLQQRTQNFIPSSVAPNQRRNEILHAIERDWQVEEKVETTGTVVVAQPEPKETNVKELLRAKIQQRQISQQNNLLELQRTIIPVAGPSRQNNSPVIIENFQQIPFNGVISGESSSHPVIYHQLEVQQPLAKNQILPVAPGNIQTISFPIEMHPIQQPIQMPLDIESLPIIFLPDPPPEIKLDNTSLSPVSDAKKITVLENVEVTDDIYLKHLNIADMISVITPKASRLVTDVPMISPESDDGGEFQGFDMGVINIPERQQRFTEIIQRLDRKKSESERRDRKDSVAESYGGWANDLAGFGSIVGKGRGDEKVLSKIDDQLDKQRVTTVNSISVIKCVELIEPEILRNPERSDNQLSVIQLANPSGVTEGEKQEPQTSEGSQEKSSTETAPSEPLNSELETKTEAKEVTSEINLENTSGSSKNITSNDPEPSSSLTEKEPTPTLPIKSVPSPPKTLPLSRSKSKAIPIIIPKRRPRFKPNVPVVVEKAKPNVESTNDSGSEPIAKHDLAKDKEEEISIATEVPTTNVIEDVIVKNQDLKDSTSKLDALSTSNEDKELSLTASPVKSIETPESITKVLPNESVAMEKAQTDLVNSKESPQEPPDKRTISEEKEVHPEEVQPSTINNNSKPDPEEIAEERIEEQTETKPTEPPSMVHSTPEKTPPSPTPAPETLLPLIQTEERQTPVESPPLVPKVTSLKRKRDLIKERSLFEDSPSFSKLCDEIDLGSSSLSESEAMNDDEEESITIPKSLFHKYFNKERFLAEKLMEHQKRKKRSSNRHILVVQNSPKKDEVSMEKVAQSDKINEDPVIDDDSNEDLVIDCQIDEVSIEQESKQKEEIDVDHVVSRDQNEDLVDENDNEYISEEVHKSSESDKQVDETEKEPDIAEETVSKELATVDLSKEDQMVIVEDDNIIQETTDNLPHHLDSNHERVEETSDKNLESIITIPISPPKDDPPSGLISLEDDEDEDDVHIVLRSGNKRESRRILPKELKIKSPIPLHEVKRTIELSQSNPSGSESDSKVTKNTRKSRRTVDSETLKKKENQGEGFKERDVETQLTPIPLETNPTEENLSVKQSEEQFSYGKRTRKSKVIPRSLEDPEASEETDSKKDTTDQNQWNIISPRKAFDHTYSAEEDTANLKIILKRPSTRKNPSPTKEVEKVPVPTSKKRQRNHEKAFKKPDISSSDETDLPLVLKRRSRRRNIFDDEDVPLSKVLTSTEDQSSTDHPSESDRPSTPIQSTRPKRNSRRSAIKSPEPPPSKRPKRSRTQKENEEPISSPRKIKEQPVISSEQPPEDPSPEILKKPITKTTKQQKIEQFFTPSPKTKLKIAEKNQQCGNCQEIIPIKLWKKHMMFHNGLAWIDGVDPPIDFNNVPVTAKIVQRFMAKHKLKQVNCEKCAETRKSGLGIVSHMQTCGLSEAEINRRKLQCEFCPSTFLAASMASHLTYCPGLKKQVERVEKSEQAQAKAAGKEIMYTSTGRRVHMLKRQKEDEVEFRDYYMRRMFTSRVHKKWVQEEQKKLTMRCFSNRCSFVTKKLKAMETHHNTCEKAQKNRYSCKFCLEETVTTEEIELHLKRDHFRDEIMASDEEAKDGGGDSDGFVAEEGESSTESEGSSGPMSDELENEEEEDEDDDDEDYAVEGEKEEKKGHIKRRRLQKKKYTSHTFWRGEVLEKIRPLCQNYKKFLNANFSPSPLFEHWKVPEITEILKLENQPSQSDASSGFVNLDTGLLSESVAWLPMPDDVKDHQILAVLCKAESLPYMKMSHKGPVETLIQLWKVRKDSKSFCAEHFYSIIRPDGPVFGMKCIPSGGFSEDRLGLMAITSVTGDVNILALPHEKPEFQGKRLKLPNCFTLKANVDSIGTQVEWANKKGHHLIAGGFLNGMVALWRLDTKGSLISPGNNQIYPFKIIQCYEYPIMHLSLNEDFLLVAIAAEIKILNVGTGNCDEITRHSFFHNPISCAKWFPGSLYLCLASRMHTTYQGLYVLMPMGLGVAQMGAIRSEDFINAMDYSPWLGGHIAGTERGEVLYKTTQEVGLYKADRQYTKLSMILDNGEVVEKKGPKEAIKNPQTVSFVAANLNKTFQRWYAVVYERGLVRVNELRV